MAIEELTSPPGAATLYPRAVAGATVVPLLRRLPGLSKPAGLPDTELRLDAAEIDRERLAAYARICGFPLRDTLPAPYPHLLAFPLGLRLMTAPAFPLPAIGLVHVANAITQLRPIDARERLDVRVRAADLRSHPRGTQFEMVAEAHAGGERAWISVSTYLRREGGHGSKRDRDTDPPRPSARWEVPGDTGRRYAAVSRDRNPIHLHRFSARLFGMPGAIAHGMWLKARCLAALDPALPDAFTADVRFKLPVVLPAQLAFSTSEDADGRAFALHDAKTGRPHLAGDVRPS